MKNVAQIFNMAKRDVTGYEVYAEQLASMLKGNRELLHVLEGLFHIAKADNVLHPRELEFLGQVANTRKLANLSLCDFVRFSSKRCGLVDATRRASQALLPRFQVTITLQRVIAITSTKIPILLGSDFGIFHLPPDIKRVGFWAAQHEARADLVMLLGSLFLLIVGAGRWSLDAWLISPGRY
jgi:Tellurite resistance protein TerB